MCCSGYRFWSWLDNFDYKLRLPLNSRSPYFAIMFMAYPNLCITLPGQFVLPTLVFSLSHVLDFRGMAVVHSLSLAPVFEILLPLSHHSHHLLLSSYFWQWSPYICLCMFAWLRCPLSYIDNFCLLCLVKHTELTSMWGNGLCKSYCYYDDKIMK